MLIRFSFSTVVGFFVTIALFYLMQALIQGAGSAMTEENIGNLIDFVRIKQDPEVTVIHRIPIPPPPVEPPPDLPPQSICTQTSAPEFIMGPLDSPIGNDDPRWGVGLSDGEYLPIVKVQPRFPRRALSRGMSGWVVVEFTVTAQGTVTNPYVVENCGSIRRVTGEGECTDSPNNVFDSAALKAVKKFKYKPRIFNEVPVEVTGVRNKVSFELTN